MLKKIIFKKVLRKETAFLRERKKTKALWKPLTNTVNVLMLKSSTNPTSVRLAEPFPGSLCTIGIAHSQQ